MSDRQARPNAVDDDALAIHALNAYVSTVRWCLAPTQDGMVQRWASPSFFASLAMMILQDVAGKTRPRICRTCGRVFVSSAYQARYCSPRCRHTMNKRVFRRKAAGNNRRDRRAKRHAGRRGKSRCDCGAGTSHKQPRCRWDGPVFFARADARARRGSSSVNRGVRTGGDIERSRNDTVRRVCDARTTRKRRR